jgi:hypothetical protein
MAHILRTLLVTATAVDATVAVTSAGLGRGALSLSQHHDRMVGALVRDEVEVDAPDAECRDSPSSSVQQLQ